jgi:calcium permeable stress-gated cation channel
MMFFISSMRPKPLSSSLWAFLFPHVPLVPKLPSDVSDAGKSTEKNLDLFPTDEQLSQRTIWMALLICLGWSVLALCGALPLYLVSTPCLAHSIYQGGTSGAYSVVQDLSLLRLLQLFETQNVSATTSLALEARAVINNKGAKSNGRIRTIVLTILVVVLGVLPALYKILKEFSRLVAHRRRWVEVRCEQKEMGWLSADKAPGFVGWGEKQFKDYLIKIGLSSTLVLSNEGRSGRRNRYPQKESSFSEGSKIDVETLFSIG